MNLAEREAARALAHGRLTAAIAQVLDGGGRVACLDRPRAHWWTSDDTDDLEAAANACRTCDALEACKAYIDNFPEPARCVWAGQIQTETRGTK